MTIEQRIKDELKRLSDQNSALYSTAHNLEERFQSLTDQVKDYLIKINSEMPEYDKHDASHSEAVLDIIEQLLQEKGIQNLSLLEAIVLRFCCYFHDCGMILPSYCTPLLEKVEADRNSDPAEGLEEWLKAEGRTFAQVKDLFLIPGSQDGYLDLLLGELEAYQAYWQGLPPAPESMEEGDYRKTKRHDHLRNTHSERTKTYAANLSRFFEEIIQGGEMDLAKAIGDICAAHGWEYKKVRELRTELELFRNCPEMRCNVRYLAMLLRMGDLLHFGPDRASGVLYYEQEQVGPQSDLHWRAKMNTRGYRIDPTAGGGVDITYHGSFTEPTEYYFILEHMNRVDEELICYESFRREMEKQRKENLYDLGLPEKVDRDHIAAQGFEPDQDLKFKLEHQNIIQLLMGARLYRDEFMCLRELYQNALDACRCMRAEQQTRYGAAGELEIEFGLGSDDGGDYLYCKDQGTGMTMDIVKNYLLRIGNSYYKSDEFRRRNAQRSNAVAPVSEFGIGLLSCYMIADRIDIITRHYSAPEGEPPIWISMKDADGFGYRRRTNRFQKRQLGDHGTIVKLYLKEEYKENVTSYLPEFPEDAVYAFASKRFSLENIEDLEKKTEEEVCNTVGLSSEATRELLQYSVSLYRRIQEYVHVPETGIPVYICGINGTRVPLIDSLKPYNYSEKVMALYHRGFTVWLELYGYSDILNLRHYHRTEILDKDQSKLIELFQKQLNFFKWYQCKIHDPATHAEAYSTIHLPCMLGWDKTWLFGTKVDTSIGNVEHPIGKALIHIDGIPVTAGTEIMILTESKLVEQGILYNYLGEIRPSLTVDRGEIRAVPHEVFPLQNTLKRLMTIEIVRTVLAHFAQFPNALAADTLAYIFRYFQNKYSDEVYCNIIKLLASEINVDFRVYGIPMAQLFSSEIVCIPEFTGNSHPAYSLHLMHMLLGNANRIVVNNDSVSFYQTPVERDAWVSVGPTGEKNIIVADEWTGRFEQYDVVNRLWPIVPPRLRAVYSDMDPRKDKISGKRTIEASDYFYFLHFSPLPKLDDHINTAMSEVLLLLQENGADRRVHSFHHSFSKHDQTKQYVFYMYRFPTALTAEQQAIVAHYDHIPQYREGVEKGWSILFYNYKNGYVIAPGIVDRMEMLKLLPDEALNHDDGLEYYFTDGTRAF